jgi:hypothetical protein
MEALPFPAPGKDGDNAAWRLSAGSNCAYLCGFTQSMTKDVSMNFKGISAPLNAGRLEQMLALAASRRDAETQDANDKPSGNEPVRGLEAENLYRSSAYK